MTTAEKVLVKRANERNQFLAAAELVVWGKRHGSNVSSGHSP